MLITCPNCNHSQEVNAAKQLGSIGGKKSRRTLTTEQSQAMAAAKRVKTAERKGGL